MEPNSVFATTGTLTATPGTLNYHTTINPNTNWSTISSGTSVIFNPDNNMSSKQQVKVAVFRVTRDEFGNIESSQFLEEMWIEQTPGKSIDFAVAKQLEEDVEADEIVIKQLQSVTL